MERQDELKAKHKIPITEDCYIQGKLLDGNDVAYCLIWEQLNHLCLKHSTFHTLPKFVSRTKNILVGNGQYVGVLFVILVVIDLHGYRF